MDPFSAIGLASNIITFLEFGYDVLSKARNIQVSASGASSTNASLSSMAQRLDEVASSLQGSGAGATTSSEEQSLTKLAAECRELCADLLPALEALRAKKPSSRRSALWAALRETTGRRNLDELQRRIDRCRQQLSVELAVLTRSELRDRLTKLTEYGQCSKDELESLSRNMESLRIGTQVSCLSPIALDQVRELLNLSDQAMTKVRESRVLAALRFELMDERFHDVKEAHENTHCWIFESSPCGLDTPEDRNSPYGDIRQKMEEACSSFKTWLKDGQGIFYISGKPGAGKSTLMKYLCCHPKTLQQLECWAGPKTLVFAKFFFWKPGTELQKSLAGLIRGLLYCLLSNSPGLIPVALPAQWAESRVQVDVYLDRDQILNAFDKVMSSSESSRGHKFFFMIDGLDEFTGNHAELVRRLFDWTRKAADVKMCVSSREWAIFQDRFKDCSRIKLHELTRSDIQRVVRDRLREPECAALLQEARCNPDDLEESITDKADGVFLWVSTILRQIEEGIINGDQMSDLEHKIDSLPTDLEYMFQHLFDSIARPDQRIAYLILEVALLVSETKGGRCCLSRYSFLKDYLTDTNFAISLPVKPIDRLLIVERLKRAQRRIYGICKGFLEIVSYSAQGESESLPTFASKFGRASGILEAEREANSLFGGAVKFTHRSIVEFLSGPFYPPQDAVCAARDRHL